MSSSPSPSALADTTGKIRAASSPTTSVLKASHVSGERLLTVKEAAHSLGLCVDSVRRHLRSGKLQGVRVGGSWRVPESKLAVQLGLLAVAAVPVADAVEIQEERKQLDTKMVVVTTSGDTDNQLLDTLFETGAVRARVLQLVEAASLSAAISPDDREHLAHEIEKALGVLSDAHKSQA